MGGGVGGVRDVNAELGALYYFFCNDRACTGFYTISLGCALAVVRDVNAELGALYYYICTPRGCMG